MNEQQRDERSWKTAIRRAKFKRSLLSYVLVILFLWAIWWFTDGRYYDDEWGIPWPVWVMLGWGLGLVFQYLRAYGGDDEDRVEKEYNRLKQKEEQQQ